MPFKRRGKRPVSDSDRQKIIADAADEIPASAQRPILDYVATVIAEDSAQRPEDIVRPVKTAGILTAENVLQKAFNIGAFFNPRFLKDLLEILESQLGLWFEFGPKTRKDVKLFDEYLDFLKERLENINSARVERYDFRTLRSSKWLEERLKEWVEAPERISESHDQRYETQLVRAKWSEMYWSESLMIWESAIKYGKTIKAGEIGERASYERNLIALYESSRIEYERLEEAESDVITPEPLINDRGELRDALEDIENYIPKIPEDSTIWTIVKKNREFKNDFSEHKTALKRYALSGHSISIAKMVVTTHSIRQGEKLCADANNASATIQSRPRGCVYTAHAENVRTVLYVIRLDFVDPRLSVPNKLWRDAATLLSLIGEQPKKTGQYNFVSMKILASLTYLLSFFLKTSLTAAYNLYSLNARRDYYWDAVWRRGPKAGFSTLIATTAAAAAIGISYEFHVIQARFLLDRATEAKNLYTRSEKNEKLTEQEMDIAAVGKTLSEDGAFDGDSVNMAKVYKHGPKLRWGTERPDEISREMARTIVWEETARTISTFIGPFIFGVSTICNTLVNFVRYSREKNVRNAFGMSIPRITAKNKAENFMFWSDIHYVFGFCFDKAASDKTAYERLQRGFFNKNVAPEPSKTPASVESYWNSIKTLWDNLWNGGTDIQNVISCIVKASSKNEGGVNVAYLRMSELSVIASQSLGIVRCATDAWSFRTTQPEIILGIGSSYPEIRGRESDDEPVVQLIGIVAPPDYGDEFGDKVKMKTESGEGVVYIPKISEKIMPNYRRRFGKSTFVVNSSLTEIYEMSLDHGTIALSECFDEDAKRNTPKMCGFGMPNFYATTSQNMAAIPPDEAGFGLMRFLLTHSITPIDDKWIEFAADEDVSKFRIETSKKMIDEYTDYTDQIMFTSFFHPEVSSFWLRQTISTSGKVLKENKK